VCGVGVDVCGLHVSVYVCVHVSVYVCACVCLCVCMCLFMCVHVQCLNCQISAKSADSPLKLFHESLQISEQNLRREVANSSRRTNQFCTENVFIFRRETIEYLVPWRSGDHLMEIRGVLQNLFISPQHSVETVEIWQLGGACVYECACVYEGAGGCMCV
jgi:hypothetical protein